MKSILLILTTLFCYNTAVCQSTISNLKEFYEQADLLCYEKLIQQDMEKYDKWFMDSLPIIDTFLMSRSKFIRPGKINLKEENKVFILAISLANTENYKFDDNIYDYIIIDSLRSFIIACVDENYILKGYTDYEEPGMYLSLTDNFYYKKKIRNKINKTIQNIKKVNPEIIMYCSNWWGTFLYLKNNKIYIHYCENDKNVEFNEDLRRYTDVNIIRRSNRIALPLTKEFEQVVSNSYYRLTGHTPVNEVRLCPK